MGPPRTLSWTVPRYERPPTVHRPRPVARTPAPPPTPTLVRPCSATTSTPAAAARAPSWARRTATRSPTRPPGRPRPSRTLAPGLRWLDPVTGPEAHFRNKAKLVVAGRAGAPTFGILDAGGRGVDLRRCGLYEPGLAATFDPLHRVVSALGIEPYDVPGRRGELKHLIVTHSPDGEHLVRFVVRSPASVDLLRDALPDLIAALPSARVVTANVLPEHKAVLEGDTEVVLSADSHLPMRVPEVTLLLGPRSFFQTNTRVATALYAQARAWTDDLSPATVLDLYCGVGGFALHLAAPGRHVVGVETSEEAVAAAIASAHLNGLGSPEVEFVAGDATRRPAGATAGPRRRQPTPPRPRRRPHRLARLRRRAPPRLLELPPRQPRARPRGDAVVAPRAGPGLRHVPADDPSRDSGPARASLRPEAVTGPPYSAPMTFSIAAHDGDAWGVAVASKFVAVGSIVPAVRVGVGAVATQSLARWAYRDEVLDALSGGATVGDALRAATAGDDGRALRQVGAVGRDGAATFTGDECFPWAGGRGHR